MIQNHVENMIRLTIDLKDIILLDIKDVELANHEKLLERNDKKLELMEQISNSHQNLGILLSDAMQNGEDIDQYREIVDLLEQHLRELYELNGKLASIILPVRQMYKEIIDEITALNGGTLFEVSA